MTNDDTILQAANTKASLLTDFLLFTKTFFKLRTGRDFRITYPIARESHYKTIARALYRVYLGKCNKLIINIPPRYGKSSLLMNFVAWALANYPDSNFLYISVSHDLATRATTEIRSIINTAEYKKIFGVSLRGDSNAKDSFMTTNGGSIEAIGAQGTIVGKGAGIRDADRFGGCLILDDVHKPDEATSDTIREGVINWFYNTLLSRRNNGEKTPIIYIGQRVHEMDLAAHLIEQGGWEVVSLPAIDECGNALCPDLHTIQELKAMQALEEYVFAAQFQQNPQPAGGGLFKITDFPILDYTPNILMTFITADTAETSKEYNDATAFSLWGVYEIEQFGNKTGLYALHWLNCVEIFVEPKDLQAEFMSFYGSSFKSGMLPSFAIIEKKSTGTTLVSVLKDIQGLNIMSVDRTSASGSKIDRHISMQKYIANKQISLPYGAQHTKMCVEHMRKIAANGTQRRSDICFVGDTMISTIYGDKKIKDIKVGDKVITPFGTGIVSECGLTGESVDVINNIGLTGTPNHPVFYDGNFMPLCDTVYDVSKLNILSFKGLLKWRRGNLLHSIISNTDLWEERKDIIYAAEQMELKGFMLQFMNFIAERKFRKALSFTIKMATILTTTTATWLVYLIMNTLQYTEKTASNGTIQKPERGILTTSDCLRLLGIRAKKVENGIVKMLKQVSIKFVNIFVKFVTKSLNQDHLIRATAAKNVTGFMTQQIIEKSGKENVYNLKVDKYGVYYANGVLVSNCDTVYDAVLATFIDKTALGYLAHNHKKDNNAKIIFTSQKLINQSRQNIWH